MENQDTTISNSKVELPLDKLLDIEAQEIDSDLSLVIHNEVDGAVLSSTDKVSKQLRTELSEEIILKLHSAVTKVGRAYVQKKVLKNRKRLINTALNIALGQKNIQVLNKRGEVVSVDLPPSLEAIKWLYRYIDGSELSGMVKKRRKTFDEFLNDQEK